jgi:hypothetical protein
MGFPSGMYPSHSPAGHLDLFVQGMESRLQGSQLDDAFPELNDEWMEKCEGVFFERSISDTL